MTSNCARAANFPATSDLVATLWIELLAAADVFLLSSISEGIPLTLIEEMAAGVPVVCTSVGGVAEVVQHGISGLLAPAGDARELAEHVLSLVPDSAFRGRVIESAQRRARGLFSLERMHRDYVEIYERAAGRDQSGSAGRNVGSVKVLESV